LHERAAREKVGEGKVAHAMNDEEQRKYITSIKRLMTFCQKRYPADPSKMLGVGT
jgi:pre-mRNA-splicing factor 18